MHEAGATAVVGKRLLEAKLLRAAERTVTARHRHPSRQPRARRSTAPERAADPRA